MTEKTKRKEPPQTLNQKYGLLIVVMFMMTLTIYNTITIAMQHQARLDIFYPFVIQGVWQSCFFIVVIALFTWISYVSLYNLSKRRQMRLSVQALLIIFVCLYLSFNNIFSFFRHDYYLISKYQAVINDKTFIVAGYMAETSYGSSAHGYGIYECLYGFHCILVDFNKSTDYGFYSTPRMTVHHDDTQIYIQFEEWHRNVETHIYRPD